MGGSTGGEVQHGRFSREKIEPVRRSTDGVVTTGADGADETGAEPGHYCIYNTDNPEGLMGVKHQCSLEYDLDITFTLDPPVGPPIEIPLGVGAVQTASDQSTYEHPFVMACCSDVTELPDWPFSDSCESLHHRACLSDFIEHICDAPSVWLARMAEDFVGQGAESLHAASDWFENHRTDCYDHFWSGPDVLSDADLCSAEFDGFFNHTPWEPAVSWSFEILGQGVSEVSNVVIAPRSALGQQVPLAPPESATSCLLPDGNNGETPPLSSPTPGAEVSSLATTVPIEVVGPNLLGKPLSGSGDAGLGSTLSWMVD